MATKLSQQLFVILGDRQVPPLGGAHDAHNIGELYWSARAHFK